MGSRAAANSLVKRTTFSSAINIFPNEVSSKIEPSIVAQDKPSNDSMSRVPQIKSYSDIPGPKELPLIGNSWRFAPIIGKLLFFSL